MLSNDGLCMDFWAETVSHAYLVNHSPSTIIECKTLIKVLSSTSADYSN